MTIVEFYDKTAIENICGALLYRPARMILVGADRKKMERSIDRYCRVLRRAGINTELLYICTPRNNLQDIVEKLSAIVDCYKDDCVFDLTGGDDLYLVATGIVKERYGEGVKCHRFNLLNNRIRDCDSDGEVLDARSFDISVEDSVAIYGGEIIIAADGARTTYPWDFNEDFLSDIDAMWSICRKNPGLWNMQANSLGAICNTLDISSSLEVSFDRETLDSVYSKKRLGYADALRFLGELRERGLINSLFVDDKVSFKFKNGQIKRCLTVAGQILELYVASKLLSVKDKDGKPLYHDVKVGVVIGWENYDGESELPTVNEVDVLAMKGAIPIFISCKNGFFDASELYKLSTVADRFGDKYAKKVLIATEMDKMGSKSEYLGARMQDMGIRCVDAFDEMSEGEIERVFASLWLN